MTDLEFAAADPAAYSAQAHRMLEQAGVPERYRRFDHAFVVKMVAGMNRASNSDTQNGN